MVCKIKLRRDQSLQLRNKFLTSGVTVFAPSWVRQGLNLLGLRLSGVQFGVFEHFHRPVSIHRNPPKEYLTITEDFNQQSLVTLQRVARSESSNVSGIIDDELYAGIDRKVVLSIRDLVRQTVIVGSDYNSVCGGYRKPRESHERRKVYICDLAALQFQQRYNSGRLVLVEEDNQHEGILDDIIFLNTVGEKRRSYREVCALMENPTDETKKRYIEIESHSAKNASYFDTQAYSAFVKMDVVLAGIAISTMARKHDPEKKIHFKFLKYGTGFFAGRFASILEKLILPAVISGLYTMLENHIVKQVVHSIELPFFNCDEACKKDIIAFETKHGVRVLFTTNDALKPSVDDGVMVASTNCADPHAPLGNEMGFSSVDAAIAENLEGKGHIFCPNININMTEEYVDVFSPCTSDLSARRLHSNSDTTSTLDTNNDSIDQLITHDGGTSNLTAAIIPKEEEIANVANKEAELVLIDTDDAQHHDEHVAVASTNSADAHVPLDEMEISSTDIAIAENVEGKEDKICPNISIKMTEECLTPACTSDLSTRQLHSNPDTTVDQQITHNGGTKKLTDAIIPKEDEIANVANKEAGMVLITTDDALKLDENVAVASTNFADAHVPLGDEMEISRANV